jgi:hypothetical protein
MLQLFRETQRGGFERATCCRNETGWLTETGNSEMDQELSQKLGEMQIQWSAGFDSLQVV